MANVFNENVQDYFARLSAVGRNKFGRSHQSMYISDNQGNPSRDYYLSQEQAVEQIGDNFDMDNGKWYQIKYNTSTGWRIGIPFQKTPNVDYEQVVYSSEMEMHKYGNQGVDDGDLHIFGILVEEVLQ